MSFDLRKIDHVQLAGPKGCEDQARKFFVDILNFEEEEKPETLKSRGGVWFKKGDIHIHIGIEDPFTPAKKAHPAFEVKNIEKLKSHLIENEIKIIVDDKLPGASRFYTSDPFGNRLEFLEWL
ncbi:VOC family protein [Fervidibacillus halotolerans]|uniref:Glyoxalase n=1 Tax=Fervidibacillus halotolerans TaxID=2980027 RepID=A0A9E8LYQ6_9BACI|nr:VOC family protein [Fervidibacillus halotolerans]WAA11872.1 glyoxalase [Fervidibacillus halotolerans]